MSTHVTEPPRAPADGLHQRDALVVASLGVVLAVVVAAMAWLWRHETTPGDQAAAPARWPAGSSIARAAERPTLVMFAHPRCPCTRASLGELRAALASAGDVAAYVLFAVPAGASGEWVRNDRWASAASIPGVRVLPDPDGREAARFGARTSGHVVLYTAAGELAYRGGVTGARGHAGDNANRDRLVAQLRRAAAGRAAGDVYGCALADPTERSAP